MRTFYLEFFASNASMLPAWAKHTIFLSLLLLLLRMIWLGKDPHSKGWESWGEESLELLISLSLKHLETQTVHWRKGDRKHPASVLYWAFLTFEANTEKLGFSEFFLTSLAIKGGDKVQPSRSQGQGVE